VPDLPTASPRSAGLDPGFLDGPLADLLGHHATRAAALMVGGRLVWERYWDGYGPTSRFDTFSIGKAFSAAAIGLLEADGALHLDDPAHRYLPEWAQGGRRAITVRHLLTMTAGFMADLPRFSAQPDATAATLAWPLLHRPGTMWTYEQATAHAVVPIVERITGRSPLDLLQERVLGPIGAAEVGWLRDARGTCLGWRSVLASARDLCRFGGLLLARGRFGGRALLPEGFVARMGAVDPVTAAAGTMARGHDVLRRSYGLLVYHNAAGLWPGVDRRAFALLGAFGNACLVDPRHDLVFTRLVTPEDRRRPDGGFDARFQNALDITDHGVARMWRTVLGGFGPPSRLDALRARAERARLDALGRLRVRARWHGIYL
jgi:CubicO group peptidase (beta-lactamase class C family)